MDTNERKELVENTTMQWLHGFLRQYLKPTDSLNYQVLEGMFGEAASLALYINHRNIGGHVSVNIDTIGETTINWVSGSTTTTVEMAIATRDLMNVAIEVALAWSAHCEEMEVSSHQPLKRERTGKEIDPEGRKAVERSLKLHPKKTHAVKAYREATRSGLREAKLAVEQIMEEMEKARKYTEQQEKDKWQQVYNQRHINDGDWESGPVIVDVSE